jgi:hypothetical protein
MNNPVASAQLFGNRNPSATSRVGSIVVGLPHGVGGGNERLSVVDMQLDLCFNCHKARSLLNACPNKNKSGMGNAGGRYHRPAHSGFQGGSGEMGPTLEDKELSTLFEPTGVIS